jgi:hypothetical protein
MNFGGKLVEQMANKMESDDVRNAVLEIIEDKLYPHLEQIKSRHEREAKEESREEVREHLEGLPPDERETIFHNTMAELVVTLCQFRLEPVQAGRHLKTMIRDRNTVEAIALIMDQEAVFSDRDDGEVETAQKDTLVTYLHWAGVALAPEMYSEEEVKEMIEQTGSDPEILDKWEKYNDPDEIEDEMRETADTEK